MSQHPKQEKREGYEWALLLKEENIYLSKFPLTSYWLEMLALLPAYTSQFVPMTGYFANSILLAMKKGKLTLEWATNRVFPKSTGIWGSGSIIVVIFQFGFLSDYCEEGEEEKEGGGGKKKKKKEERRGRRGRKKKEERRRWLLTLNLALF